MDSDYAVNKYATGIVYRFAGETVEVTLEDYLRENPDKSEHDFRELKDLSDAIYLDQVRAENAQTKRNISLYNMDDVPNMDSIPMEEAFVNKQEYESATKAIRDIFMMENITEIQRRRFYLHIVKGLSIRRIARLEGTSHVAVLKSIQRVLEKINNYFLE